MMCSNLGHVTEVKSNINDKTISFLMLQDGKPVNTGRFMIKDLHGPGLVTVNVHEAIHRLRTIPRLKISVLINGKPKMILKPILLVMCVRIIFNCDSAGGTPTLIVKGLDTKKKDCILRISFLKERRGREYGNRENDPRLARTIWEGPLEEEEVDVSDNETSEAVAAPVDFCFIVPNGPIPELNDDLLNNEAQISSTISPSSLSGSSYDLLENIDVVGQPSTALSLTLTYKKPSVVDGLGEVAVIPSSGINDNIFHQMSNALIGFICEDEPPKFTSRRESLIERLKEFGECQVGLLRDGFYALFFSNDGPGDECKTKVLEHGQLFINNRPLILRRWTQQLSSMVPSQFLKSFPVWIKIHNLDLEYWSSDSLSGISSMIGNPVSMDKFTASILRDPQSIIKICDSTSGRHLDIARVRVEIDPHSVLPDTVNVSVEGKLVSVRVEYEWKPQPCTHCRSLYHHSNSCNIDRGDVYLHPQDLQSQERSVQDPGILYNKPVLVEELIESFEPNLGNTTMPSPHSSDDDIPGLISDNDEVDEDDDGIIVPGESGRQSTELSIPESLNDALRGDVPEVESTRLRKLLSRIISRVFSSRGQHLHRSITL